MLISFVVALEFNNPIPAPHRLSTAGKTTSTITSASRPVVRTSRPASSFGEPTIACAPTNGCVCNAVYFALCIFFFLVSADHA